MTDKKIKTEDKKEVESKLNGALINLNYVVGYLSGIRSIVDQEIINPRLKDVSKVMLDVMNILENSEDQHD